MPADLLLAFAAFGAGAVAAGVPLVLRMRCRSRGAASRPGPGVLEPAFADEPPEAHGWTPPELGPRRTVPLLEVPAPRCRVRFPLGQLAWTLDRGRRRSTAESVLAHELDGLPIRQWLIERNVRVGERVVPFVVVGPTGVFAIGATDATWTLPELIALADLAAELTREMGAARPRVEAAICLALESQPPRCVVRRIRAQRQGRVGDGRGLRAHVAGRL